MTVYQKNTTIRLKRFILGNVWKVQARKVSIYSNISTNKGENTYKPASVRYRHLVKYTFISKTY